MTEREKPKTTTSIKKLIADVDAMKYDFKDYLFRGVPDIGVVGLILLVMVMVQTLSITTGANVYIQLLITSGAFIVALLVFYTTIYPKWDKIFSEYKAGKMCKSLNYNKEETKVLLTALISLKIRQPKTKLSIVYRLEPEIFTKKSLIQSLYEL